MLKMVFFSKNKKTAMRRLRELQEGVDSNYYKKFSGVKLAKKQIEHIQGWKTWEMY